ncbi:hypothetical protein SAMN05443668_104218 [Cryptosporangium aurantiacum]|uniref:Uncharacterized protein n=1 Tax=Cryptosporangium aurantiacum TaxID=134849 RepID=A0A1M7Q6H0_9ACTN|nr:hypothetical protein SAMN05443668_104218 [Cryptosporangium aurantiacum]
MHAGRGCGGSSTPRRPPQAATGRTATPQQPRSAERPGRRHRQPERSAQRRHARFRQTSPRQVPRRQPRLQRARYRRTRLQQALPQQRSRQPRSRQPCYQQAPAQQPRFRQPRFRRARFRRARFRRAPQKRPRFRQRSRQVQYRPPRRRPGARRRLRRRTTIGDGDATWAQAPPRRSVCSRRRQAWPRRPLPRCPWRRCPSKRCPSKRCPSKRCPGRRCRRKRCRPPLRWCDDDGGFAALSPRPPRQAASGRRWQRTPSPGSPAPMSLLRTCRRRHSRPPAPRCGGASGSRGDAAPVRRRRHPRWSQWSLQRRTQPLPEERCRPPNRPKPSHRTRRRGCGCARGLRRCRASQRRRGAASCCSQRPKKQYRNWATAGRQVDRQADGPHVSARVGRSATPRRRLRCHYSCYRWSLRQGKSLPDQPRSARCRASGQVSRPPPGACPRPRRGVSYRCCQAATGTSGDRRVSSLTPVRSAFRWRARRGLHRADRRSGLRR